ncbi:MAG TPA: biotin--[acetyl-CoA-carboxylase] ligase [Anaerolineales bacterium]|nr:biotin--[acetyl-CoA-carboxylase] ligase [Anaerolineales bacterium]
MAGWHASCILEYNLGVLSEERLRASLPLRGLGAEFHFHGTIGSTNDEAASRARQGAPEGTVVVAEEQTAGRGRAGRAWLTPPGSALALSIVLRPRALAPEAIGGLTALGALAVAEALEAQGVAALIKWPNDVLLDGRKVAGVLVEGSWAGQELEYAIVGIGVNVRPASVPAQAAYPATCVEEVVGRSIDRDDLLVGILDGVGRWYPRLGSEALLEAWERRLAFRGQEVSMVDESGRDEMRGVVEGLLADGRLKLRTGRGEQLVARPEGYHLRPVDTAAA